MDENQTEAVASNAELSLEQRLRNVQSNFGASRRQCDDGGKMCWDAIDAAVEERQRWRATADELASLKVFMSGWIGSASCKNNDMEPVAQKWIEALTRMNGLRDIKA